MPQICVLGLGYAGLPVAVAFARHFPGTIAFDVDREKVARLRRGEDRTGTVEAEVLRRAALRWTSEPADLAPADVYVVAVPTPIDADRRPDLGALLAATRTVGAVLAAGDVVVYESTVYPGVTREVCAPLLAEVSGLAAGVDFRVAYSPERTNPGDPEHGFERLPKVIAAEDEQALEVLRTCYGRVLDGRLVEAPSIEVAEAAKVIENVQRDLNVALVNELAQLFDRLGLETRAVLEVAATKWNFHPYRPGLVGGHCIGVDPYYLTTRAEEAGFTPRVVLAGRRTNDGMGAFVARRVTQVLAEHGFDADRPARLGVLGIAFKPNVGDLRNSQVPAVIADLRAGGAEVLVHDPLIRAEDALAATGLELVGRDTLVDLDAVLLAVAHDRLLPLVHELVEAGVRIVLDPTWGLERGSLPAGVRTWSL